MGRAVGRKAGIVWRGARSHKSRGMGEGGGGGGGGEGGEGGGGGGGGGEGGEGGGGGCSWQQFNIILTCVHR